MSAFVSNLIPDELLVDIFGKLQVIELVRCRQLSSQTKALIDSESTLQYKIETLVANVRDGLGCPLSVKERLASLQTYSAAWANLNWTPSSGKILILEGGFWDVQTNVLAQCTDVSAIEFHPLPSGTRGRHPSGTESWSVKLDIDIGDFTFDINQDLLVAVEDPAPNVLVSAVHILSTRTGMPHEMAKYPVLEIFQAQGAVNWSVVIEIRGDLVAVMWEAPPFSGLASMLRIWQWKIGECVLHYESPLMERYTIMDDDYVLIVVRDLHINNDDMSLTQTPALCLHRLFNASYPGVRSVEGWGGDTLRITGHDDRKSSLVLPSFTSVNVWSTRLFSNTVSSVIPPGSSAPFHARSDDRILTIKIYGFTLSPDDDVPDDFEPAGRLLCVPERIVRRLLLGQRDEQQLDIPWSKWGRQGARLLPEESVDDVWICVTHGPRLITSRIVSDTDADSAGSLHVTIHDFSEYGTRRNDATHIDGMNRTSSWIYHGSNARALEPESSIVHCSPQYDDKTRERTLDEWLEPEPKKAQDTYFLEDVTTDLPYRSVTRSLDGHIHGHGREWSSWCMLAEDNIVLVNYSPFHGDHYTFLTL